MFKSELLYMELMTASVKKKAKSPSYKPLQPISVTDLQALGWGRRRDESISSFQKCLIA